MSQNEALAAAALLHVLLRRKTGRVTDTEWMASNTDYAQAMVRFAREKAASDGHTDLLALADRLDALMARIDARTHNAPLHAVTARSRAEPQDTALAANTRDDSGSRYIGRLR